MACIFAQDTGKILFSENKQVKQALQLISKKKVRLALWFMAALWAGMQVFFLWRHGIVTNGEATKYIFEAGHFLAEGKYSSGNFLFYSTQIMLIAFCMKMQIGYWLLVLFQIIMNGISVICFYFIVKRISGRSWLPLLATFYFLVFFYYHLYNTFLYTESLFFSFSVIYTFVLFRIEKLSYKNGLIILLFLAILYFTRPTGIFFIPATWLFLILRFYPKRTLKVLMLNGIAGCVILFFLVNYSLSSGGEFDFLLPYINENIICGVPAKAGLNDLSIPVEKNSIQGLIYVVTNYSDLFVRLAFKRLAAFYGAMRTFYSLPHNLILAAYYYSAYLMILFSIRNLFKKNMAEVGFLLAIILLMTVTVALSCDEWGNRFLLSITPFILLLMVLGITNRANPLKKI